MVWVVVGIVAVMIAWVVIMYISYIYNITWDVRDVKGGICCAGSVKVTVELIYLVPEGRFHRN